MIEVQQPKRFMTVNETVKFTGLSMHYIRHGIREGWIPFIRVGNKAMINYPKLIAILDKESCKQ